MNKQELETILKDNFQDNFRIEVDYSTNNKEIISLYWLDGTPASTVKNILQIERLKNKLNGQKIILFRNLSNAYILEKFEILTKEFKFLNNTLKKLKKEHDAGVIFYNSYSTTYSLINKTIKNKFQYSSLFKDKTPESVESLINLYFKY